VERVLIQADQHGGRTLPEVDGSDAIIASVLRLLASGFDALEGPVVDETGNLYVSEIKRGGVLCMRPNGDVDTVIADRTGIGGLCLHAHGGLVVSGPDLSHIDPDTRRVLLDVRDVPAKAAVALGFNDIHADGNGSVLAGVRRAGAPGELLCVTGERQYEVVHDDLHPNGIAYSPDGDRLYAVDMDRRRVLVLGSTVSSFSTDMVPGLPDGLATDEDGFVWIAFYRGRCVARFDPDGSLARLVTVPAEKPLSLCFGGPDRTDLYIVTGSSGAETGCVFVLPVDVPGTRVDPARI
jgi:sugar lactone lactonase YvrE